MALTVLGRINWEGGSDDSGHRTYHITYRIQSDDPDTGPATLLQVPGLPVPGSIWFFGNDLDVYAWMRPNIEVRPEAPSENEWVKFWTLTLTFSTRPPSRDAGGRAAPGTGGGDFGVLRPG